MTIEQQRGRIHGHHDDDDDDDDEAYEFRPPHHLEHHRREPDLVLRPCQEGLDFTLKLIDANPMSKIVELHVDDLLLDETRQQNENPQFVSRNLCNGENNRRTNQFRIMESSKDMHDIFSAVGGYETDDYYDDDDQGRHDHRVSSTVGGNGGLRFMESLTVISSKVPPSSTSISLLKPLTMLLANTTSTTTTTVSTLRQQTPHHYFNSLCLIDVNLQGSLLEFRAFVECLRIHPYIRYVQISGNCAFTPEQRRHFKLLKDVFENKNQQRQQQQLNRILVLVPQQQISRPSSRNISGSDENWFEILIKSWFCWM